MAYTERRYELSDLTEVGGGTSLTNNGTATFTAGKVGDAATLVAASSQYLTVNESIFNAVTTEQFTMWGWFKLDSTGVNHGICGQGTSSYHCHVITTNKLRFRVNRSTGGTLSLDYSGTLTSGVWYFFVVEYDLSRSIISLEINRTGRQTATCTSGLVSNSGDWSIGSIGSGNFCNGQIDQVGFRRGALLTEYEKDLYYAAGSGFSFAAFDALGTETEIVDDYIDAANAYRWTTTAKAAKLAGSGAQDGLAWVVTTFPAEMIDTDETATVLAAGAPTLRAALNPDGTSPIAIDVQDFTPAAGGHGSGATARVWVNPGAYTAGSDFDVTFFWIAGGSQKQPSENAAMGAFEVYTDYGAAWEFDEDPSGTAPQMRDKTVNANHGTSTGTMTSGDQVDLVEGTGLDFDGSNDSITALNSASLKFDGAAGLTFGLAFNTNSQTNYRTFISIRNGSLSPSVEWLMGKNETTDEFYAGYYDGAFQLVSTGWAANFTNGDRYFAHVTIEEVAGDTTVRIYKNGALIASNTFTTSTVSSSAAQLSIGCTKYTTASTDEELSGQIAAPMVFQGVLTADQLLTLYRNHDDPADFWDATAAVEEAVSDTTVTATLALTDGADQIAAEASPFVDAALALTDGADELAITASPFVNVTLSLTDGADQVAATVTVVDSTITVSLALVDGADIIAALGGPVVNAALTLVDGADIIAAAGGALVTASVTLTDGADLIAAILSDPNNTIRDIELSARPLVGITLTATPLMQITLTARAHVE